MVAADIASALNTHYISDVYENWPLLQDALHTVFGNDVSHNLQVATVATVVAETGPVFAPIEEYGGWSYYVSELGQAEAAYHGRGFIQLTWSSNYKYYGDLLGVDLLNDPNLALDPKYAALILAYYFKENGVLALANAGDWYGVRRAVNGGLNGLDVFLRVVNEVMPLPDGSDTRVAITSPLKTEPKADSPDALDELHRPIKALAVGTEVVFVVDPRTGTVTTPHWAHIHVKGSAVHGWYLRALLETKVY